MHPQNEASGSLLREGAGFSSMYGHVWIWLSTESALIP